MENTIHIDSPRRNEERKLLREVKWKSSHPESFRNNTFVLKGQMKIKGGGELHKGESIRKKVAINRFPRQVFCAAEYTSVVRTPNSFALKMNSPSKDDSPSGPIKRISSLQQLNALPKASKSPLSNFKTVAAKLKESSPTSLEARSSIQYESQRLASYEIKRSNLPRIEIMMDKSQGSIETIGQAKMNSINAVIQRGKSELESSLRSSTRLIPGEFLANAKPKYKRNLNQLSNLALVAQSKMRVKPPRVTVNLEHALKLNALESAPKLELCAPANKRKINYNLVKLHPIQRNASSSQGTTIKLLLPKAFIGAKKRPSSREEEGQQKPMIEHRGYKIPYLAFPEIEGRIKMQDFLSKFNSDRSHYCSKKEEDRLPALISTCCRPMETLKLESNREKEEICNVTFGPSQWQKEFKEAR